MSPAAVNCGVLKVDGVQAKDGRIQEAALDFDGRNVLLYFRPEAS